MGHVDEEAPAPQMLVRVDLVHAIDRGERDAPLLSLAEEVLHLPGARPLAHQRVERVHVRAAGEPILEDLLLRPLGRMRLVRDGPAGPAIDVPPRVLPPGGQRQPSAWPAHADQLGRRARVVGSEDRAEDGDHDSELRLGVRKLLAIALVEPDREPLGVRRPALLAVTAECLQYLGLRSLADLPPLPEPETSV